MRIAIGSDRSGFGLKEKIREYLDGRNYDYTDLGISSNAEARPYNAVAAAAARKVQSGECDLAVLVCGTGAGMNIVANKFRGLYAVACESPYSARMARAINDARVLCMGANIVTPQIGVEMVETFIETPYLSGMEEWRKDWLRNAADGVRKLEDELYGG